MSELSDPRRKPRSAWGRFLAGFVYAFRGLWYALRTQRNIRVHTGVALLVIAAALLFRLSVIEVALVAVAIGGVLASELFNTSIELCLDLSHPEYHPLVRTAKDVAAGAVLLSALLAVVIGICVFGPHLWAWWLAIRR
ncbi:diacylglycerol kinase family protein [Thermogemmatispora sp.]|uniref:diacylglycerol kinase family protein n=1 Tax=Thermogemmatispora sp. TaxID=1968838 RepID=UPI001D9D8048|nr:diacylglycerol kinase family protein [Thermogemmatispora sp.]MBX5449864.1 diacylglycerol kinase family protein [Thermogemmatispora sp.]